ncbi:MAG: Helix-turn-helix domain [Solirubrobacteraceae bacterium]|nr:Helix-turn-helix domain [Solirubrobacteraceae bacterium]
MDRAEDNNAADRARRNVIPGSAPPLHLTVADRLSVDGAAAEAGVSVDTIRRAYRSGALRAFRPGGTRRIVILREDLQAWAFSDEHLVTSPAAQLRPTTDAPAAISRRMARQRARRDATAGSIERLREIERSG